MSGTSQARAKAKYDSKSYDKLLVRIRKDGGNEITSEEIKQSAEMAGESVNEFILQAIRERIQQLR